MRIGLTAAGVGLALAMGALPLSATGASAAPLSVAPLATTRMPTPTPAVATGGAAKLILVRGGCGWGRHRTFAGRCHLNYGWRPRPRPPLVASPLAVR